MLIIIVVIILAIIRANQSLAVYSLTSPKAGGGLLALLDIQQLVMISTQHGRLTVQPNFPNLQPFPASFGSYPSLREEMYRQKLHLGFEVQMGSGSEQPRSPLVVVTCQSDQGEIPVLGCR